jgi:hypothetical protein
MRYLAIFLPCLSGIVLTTTPSVVISRGRLILSPKAGRSRLMPTLVRGARYVSTSQYTPPSLKFALWPGIAFPRSSSSRSSSLTGTLTSTRWLFLLSSKGLVICTAFQFEGQRASTA